MDIKLKEGQFILDEFGNKYITEGDEVLVGMLLTERVKNLSDALGVFELKSVPDEKTLKDLYRALSIKNHPDKGGSVEDMQDVNAAYELLKKNVGGGSSGKIDWNEIDRQWKERNARELANMQAMFDDEFNIEELVSYLQQFTQDELQYTIVDNSKQLKDYKSSMMWFRIHVEVFNVDRTTVFMVEYGLTYNYNTGGGLTSSDMDEKDILYNVSITANIYHDKRKEKVSQSDYRYGVGRTSFADYDLVFPSKKLQKIFSGGSKKAFKKADMLLGLKREADAEFSDDNIYFYLFGKRSETKTYISMSRTTIMRQGFYSLHNIWAISPRTRKLQSNPIAPYFISFEETQENLEKVINLLKEIKDEIRKRKWDEIEDSDELVKFIYKLAPEYFPKSY